MRVFTLAGVLCLYGTLWCVCVCVCVSNEVWVCDVVLSAYVYCRVLCLCGWHSLCVCVRETVRVFVSV